MSKKGDFSFVLNITGPLAKLLREYLVREWPDSQGMPVAFTRQALREKLERELPDPQGKEAKRGENH